MERIINMGWFEEYMTDKYVKKLQSVINGLKEKDKQIESLQEENNRLRDEHYKDEELKKLQEKIDKLQGDCNRGFPISFNEQEVIDEFREEHKKECPHCSFKYIFEPYSIVEFGYLKCNVCGEEIKFAER